MVEFFFTHAPELEPYVFFFLMILLVLNALGEYRKKGR